MSAGCGNPHGCSYEPGVGGSSFPRARTAGCHSPLQPTPFLAFLVPRKPSRCRLGDNLSYSDGNLFTQKCLHAPPRNIHLLETREAGHGLVGSLREPHGLSFSHHWAGGKAPQTGRSTEIKRQKPCDTLQRLSGSSGWNRSPTERH